MEVGTELSGNIDRVLNEFEVKEDSSNNIDQILKELLGSKCVGADT